MKAPLVSLLAAGGMLAVYGAYKLVKGHFRRLDDVSGE
jgi:hypothetical protein